jgi:tetratricopeptide (TPR) repeat protein
MTAFFVGLDLAQSQESTAMNAPQTRVGCDDGVLRCLERVVAIRPQRVTNDPCLRWLGVDERPHLPKPYPNFVIMLATTEVGASQSGLQGFWKALPLSEQTLQKRQVRLGPDHPSTLRSMNNLTVAYQAADQLDKAVPLLERTLDKQKTNLRPDHPDTLNTMNNLAQAYQQAGRHDRAEPLLWELLEQQRKKTGPESPSTAGMLDRLGLNLLQESKIHG